MNLQGTPLKYDISKVWLCRTHYFLHTGISMLNMEKKEVERQTKPCLCFDCQINKTVRNTLPKSPKKAPEMPHLEICNFSGTDCWTAKKETQAKALFVQTYLCLCSKDTNLSGSCLLPLPQESESLEGGNQSPFIERDILSVTPKRELSWPSPIFSRSSEANVDQPALSSPVAPSFAQTHIPFPTRPANPCSFGLDSVPLAFRLERTFRKPPTGLIASKCFLNHPWLLRELAAALCPQS